MKTFQFKNKKRKLDFIHHTHEYRKKTLNRYVWTNATSNFFDLLGINIKKLKIYLDRDLPTLL